MNRVILFFLVFAFNSCSSQNKLNSKIYECKILEIKKLDDGHYCFYIENNNEKSIIIEYNEKLSTSDCQQIVKGNKYFLNLEKIDTNFRGENDKYVLISENGTQTTIWSKNDNYPLLLYKANNINELCVVGGNFQK